VVYPGNPQGRHLNERGARGVYLVDVDESGDVSTEFRPVDLVRWDVIEIDTGEMESEQSLIDTLGNAFQKSLDSSEGRSIVARIILKNPSPIHNTLIRDDYIDQVRDQMNDNYGSRNPFLWCERISVSTSPPFDRKERIKGTDFIADLLKLSDVVISDDDALDELIKSISPIYTQGKTEKYTSVFKPDREEIKELLAEAENLYLARLLEEGDQ
jgi:DNA repair exonuclease SbcCD nuclease subunit